ncbi:chitobiosyldiphosphodolichol beta-mannosyltransferase [Anoplophora glabripennis]|nr:chitobiosyldiphosphodolichol beta-mannosyltransferase [Anoplophora glabripennis]XP_018572967.1 chitobiosyldiphosphodolichol beta-mannosyltransferase [Anoplophora glabripennis]
MEDVKKNACVVVLGDIGRSPRMQYHSLSLAEMGYVVDIIGYGETEPMEEVKTAPLLYYHYLLPCPRISLKFVNYIFKTIWQAINLLFLLFVIRKPDILLVQNPPAIPTLSICWFYCKTMGSKFVIDWHNYAHTIMALSLHKHHPLVKLTKKIELFIGRKADNNFCVTNAMNNDLSENWNISAVTLYDKPPKIFQPITLKQKHAFLKHLGESYKNLTLDDNSTLFTKEVNNEVYLKKDRPGLIVSSTSWTEDEDFSILLTALQDYENHILNGNEKTLPDLICFITGKGPLKSYYSENIAKRNWQHISIITPWLESKDYPTMLASADLGVCLHTSSSGLDLPMKVVDMFGCGLPVCAYDFKCLGELVKHGKNGYKFTSAEGLSEQLQEWFENFPHNEKQQEKETQFKTELHTFQKLRWTENWVNMAWPVLK